MKRQLSATSASPSRFCRILLLVAGFKLCLLATFLLEPFAGLESWLPSSGRADAVRNATAPSLPATVVQDGGAGRRQRSELAAQSKSSAPGQSRPEPGVAFAAQPAPADAPAQGREQADRLSMETLNRRQEELARKEQALKALEAELNARLEEMQALENRLQVMLKDAEETKDAKFKHLVDVLSNMKARQAAEVLETLDEKIAVRVLAGMRGRQAGEILTYASPAKAARLTEALARMQIPLE